jgi:hypothetical protein
MLRQQRAHQRHQLQFPTTNIKNMVHARIMEQLWNDTDREKPK